MAVLSQHQPGRARHAGSAGRGSSYGTLVAHVRRTAEGQVTEVEYGDGAGTTTAMVYDDLRRLRNITAIPPASQVGTREYGGYFYKQQVGGEGRYFASDTDWGGHSHGSRVPSYR